MNITIHEACAGQAEQIAELIMTAMTHECCMHFTGEGQTIDDFRLGMTELVKSETSQYSYRNTLVATDEAGEVCGICVSYDGARLHELREAFVEMAKKRFGRDFSNMDDETQPGELYIDSLAVQPRHRGKGIATRLLRATAEKAKAMRLPATGLLVDKGNPTAERLYRSLGFEYANDSSWGGHPMRHLQLTI